MTVTEAKDIGNKLIQLLTQQKFLYRQLKELSQKQSSLLDGNDPEMLLKILAGRQRLIDRLSLIDRELRPIRADWQKVAASLPLSQREEAMSLIESVQEILGEIIARDEIDTQTLHSQQQKVATEIHGTVTGKRVHQAYAQATIAPPARGYFDATSE
jgi:hypothetical protein